MSVERRASGSSRDMVTAPKTRLVQKQQHLLAYITPAEAALLKKNGGTGEMVNGIPAFPVGSVSKAKVDKAKAKTSTKAAPAKSTTKTVTSTGSRGSEKKAAPAKSTTKTVTSTGSRGSEKKAAPAPKEKNDPQPVVKAAPAKSTTKTVTNTGSRGSETKAAPAPKEKNDPPPVTTPTLSANELRKKAAQDQNRKLAAANKAKQEQAIKDQLAVDAKKAKEALAAEAADFKVQEEATRKKQADADAKVKADADAKVKADEAADFKAQEEATRKKQAEADAKVKADAEAKKAADAKAAKEEAELKASVEKRAVQEAIAKAEKEAAAKKIKEDEAADFKVQEEATRKKQADAEAKKAAEDKAAKEQGIKDQLAADAKKAKAALAVEGTNTITQSTKGPKGAEYLPAGSTTDVRGLTMDTTQNPRLDKNGNVVSAEDAKYLGFTDMIDGGGPGRAGPEFQTKSQAKDSPTGGEKTGTIASFIGATPLNSGIEPTGIAGFVDSGGLIGTILNKVLGPDTRTEEEKAAALLLQQQQMERDSNRDSGQPNPVAPGPPPDQTTDPYLSTPISSGMYGNVGQVSAQDLMVGGNQTSQDLLTAARPRDQIYDPIPFSEPTKEEMDAFFNDPARRQLQTFQVGPPTKDPNGPAGQLASIYGPPGQGDPMYPGATPYQVGPQMASVYGQPVNGTLPGSYNPLAAQQAAPVPAPAPAPVPQAAPTFADLYGGGQQQLPGQPYYGIMG